MRIVLMKSSCARMRAGERGEVRERRPLLVLGAAPAPVHTPPEPPPSAAVKPAGHHHRTAGRSKLVKVGARQLVKPTRS